MFRFMYVILVAVGVALVVSPRVGAQPLRTTATSISSDNPPPAEIETVSGIAKFVTPHGTVYRLDHTALVDVAAGKVTILKAAAFLDLGPPVPKPPDPPAPAPAPAPAPPICCPVVYYQPVSCRRGGVFSCVGRFLFGGN